MNIFDNFLSHILAGKGDLESFYWNLTIFYHLENSMKLPKSEEFYTFQEGLVMPYLKDFVYSCLWFKAANIWLPAAQKIYPAMFKGITFW